jgi:hypothetical protein
MHDATPSHCPPKVISISRRFSFTLIGVVSSLLLSFAVIGIFFIIEMMDSELENRMSNAMKLAMISLPTPLWNLDNDIAEDFVEALFLD